MEKKKRWRQIKNDKNELAWTTGKMPFKIGDKYTYIEFTPPTKRKIGSLHIIKHTVNWVDGLASSTKSKDVHQSSPKTRTEGIAMAKRYMKSHPNG